MTFVRERRVPAVFCESTVSNKAQEQVARESGARFAGVLYVDSLSEADGPVPTYLDLLRRDADTIIAGLTGAYMTHAITATGLRVRYGDTLARSTAWT